MRTHDKIKIGHVENTKYNGYNEVVFDCYTHPWEKDLKDIIQAVFIQSGATPKSKAYGRVVHQKLVEFLASQGVAEDAMPPLLEYSALSVHNAFSMVPPPSSPPPAPVPVVIDEETSINE